MLTRILIMGVMFAHLKLGSILTMLTVTAGDASLVDFIIRLIESLLKSGQ
jgi:hypothetical protein